MAIFVLDRTKLTLTLHRTEQCSQFPKQPRLDCGCSANPQAGGQVIFCEDHLETHRINQLTEGCFWMLQLCSTCYPR